MRASLLVSLALCLSAAVVGVSGAYTWETRNFTAQIDNLNFQASGQTFQLKYLVNKESYKPGGPIFFYTGNEGPIELFAENTGFMWDIAPEFDAMLVFAEHRYYGDSLPFGQDSFTNENYVHLSAEQALADFALFLTAFKAEEGIPDARVISFGGSYGGMLTAWFRLKYPHIVDGGIAASAPIWQFDTASSKFDEKAYNRICSDDFRAVSQTCFDQIAASWNSTFTIASGPKGLETISKELGLCTPLTSIDDVVNTIYPWIANVYATLPMGDYPFAAEFLGPLPPNPVNVACSYWTEQTMTDLQRVEATRRSVGLFYNFSGQAGSCHNLTAEAGIATLGAGTQWPYQSCTEMVMPIGQYGPPSDLFYYAPWNLTATIAQCKKQFDVTPQPHWITTQYGGPQDWKDATNIVFSNGDLDPWAGGGVRKTISETVVYVPVKGGAHHLDLRAADPNDPPGAIWARNEERKWIRRFLSNPNPASNPDKDGLTKKQVALISVFSTFGVCLLLAALVYCCCLRKMRQNAINDYSTMDR